jgi:hypothetical protein
VRLLWHRAVARDLVGQGGSPYGEVQVGRGTDQS